MKRHIWIVAVAFAALLWWSCQGCASGPKQVRVLNTRTTASAVGFSSDGRSLVAYCTGTPGWFEKDEIVIWEVATWHERAKQETIRRGKHTRKIATAFSPDSRLVAVSVYDKQADQTLSQARYPGEVRVFDTTTLQEKAVFRHNLGVMCVLAFSPDSNTLVISSFLVDSGLKLIDIPSFKERVIPNKIDSPGDIVFRPDGKLLVVTRTKFSLLDPTDGKLRSDYYLPGLSGRLIAFLPDGNHLAVLAAEAVPQIWDVSTGQKVAEFGQPNSWFTKRAVMSVSPTGKWLVVSAWSDRDRSTQVRLLNLESKKEHSTWKVNGGGFNSWTFSPDEKYLVGGGWGGHDDNSPGNGRIMVWRLED